MKLFRTRDTAQEMLPDFGSAFAEVENPPGTFPSRELVPLGPTYKKLSGMPKAIFLDMDGTMTCTEPLFLHGVEAVVRRSTGWNDQSAWPGLDPVRDHPKIVGFNTLRNLEYLFGLVGEEVRPDLFFQAVDEALVFLAAHNPPQDIRVRIEALLAGYDLADWWSHAHAVNGDHAADSPFPAACSARFSRVDLAMFSQFGLVVFYADYLDALVKVNRGEGASVSMAIHGTPDIPAVAPMPGMALLCTLLKGWLTPKVAPLVLAAHGREGVGAQTLGARLGQFVETPIPVALVTSSGTHETGLVLESVFREMRGEVAAWSLPADNERQVLAGLASPSAYFDTIVTCDDVTPGRTKPYRDPYSLALEQLGLDGCAAAQCIGFEDTEAGVIAQRGAGIGIPCAVPIEFTQHQDFSAAAHVLHEGILEALLEHGMFLP
jgi:beta-phosphoglucomutase-like phosphatase (HAD superfamily)